MHNNDTKILDRLMLSFLVEQFGFSLLIKKINESSKEPKEFLKIVKAAINSVLTTLNMMFQLNDDIVDIMLGLWINGVMVDFI